MKGSGVCSGSSIRRKMQIVCRQCLQLRLLNGLPEQAVQPSEPWSKFVRYSGANGAICVVKGNRGAKTQLWNTWSLRAS